MVDRRRATLSIVALLFGIAALWIAAYPVAAGEGNSAPAPAPAPAPTPAALPAAIEASNSNVFFPAVAGRATEPTPAPTATQPGANRVFLPAIAEPLATVTATATATPTFVESAITGMLAANNSPTLLKSLTSFTATINTGTNISYTWGFGDSATGSGANATHTYAAVGSYRAVVTATNSLSRISATTTATVFEIPITGLTAASSPTTPGTTTYFTATVSSGSNVTYTWNFGNGSIGSGANLTHTYASVGSYTAVVTATNSLSRTTASTTVTVAEIPIMGLIAASSPTTPGSATHFTATISGGSNVTYTWSFGDGNVGNGASPTHTYATVGSYTAIVTATNGLASATATTTVAVADAPITGLSAASSPTTLGTATIFAATISGGSNVTYTWSFGDGNSGSGPSPTHTYRDVGSYTATVTVSNSISSAAAATTVKVADAPIMGLTAASSPTTLGDATTFTATISGGTHVTYAWNFGDGNSGSGANVTHTYAALGAHPAIVTASNDAGSVSAHTIVLEEIYIPAASFQMGCDSKNAAETCYTSELPLHPVTLNAYYIGKYEVTNVGYQACVDAGGCTAPGNVNSAKRDAYYGAAAYANYPVVYVTWHQVNVFCTWAGKRLPTEAEWEKAARGSNDTRKYPWGNTTPSSTLLNYNWSGIGDTTPAGAYPAGASPYGVMDMAGNVWEWVNDWYGSSYYRMSPTNNPTGPATGTNRVLRSGSWDFSINFARTVYRGNIAPTHASFDTGFRCVRSP